MGRIKHPELLENPESRPAARIFAEEAFEALALYGHFDETVVGESGLVRYLETGRYDIDTKYGVYAFNIKAAITSAGDVLKKRPNLSRLAEMANAPDERYRVMSFEHCDLGVGWQADLPFSDADLNWQPYLVAIIDFAELDETVLVHQVSGVELSPEDAEQALQVLRLVRAQMSAECLEDAAAGQGPGYAAGIGPNALSGFKLRLVN